jgi:hypothetical protein
MQNRKPARTTENLGAWVTADVRERAREDSIRFGYGTSGLSAYISDLVLGQDAARAVPARPAQETAVIGSKVVRALSAIDERVRAGDSGEALLLLRADLQALRGEVVAALASCVAEYEHRTDLRLRGEDWDVG